MNFELPPQPSSAEDEDLRQERGNEAPNAAVAEQAGKRPSDPALPAIPDDIPTAEPPSVADGSQASQGDSNSFDPHQLATETDRIEPEWVEKAKALISQTRDDPYMQKDEMSKIKADYIQKRFNKHLKTDETET